MAVWCDPLPCLLSSLSADRATGGACHWVRITFSGVLSSCGCSTRKSSVADAKELHIVLTSSVHLAASQGLRMPLKKACAISRSCCRRGSSGGSSGCIIFMTRWQAMLRSTLNRGKQWLGSPFFLATTSSCTSDATRGYVRTLSMCVAIPHLPMCSGLGLCARASAPRPHDIQQQVCAQGCEGFSRNVPVVGHIKVTVYTDHLWCIALSRGVKQHRLSRPRVLGFHPTIPYTTYSFNVLFAFNMRQVCVHSCSRLLEYFSFLVLRGTWSQLHDHAGAT